MEQCVKEMSLEMDVISLTKERKRQMKKIIRNGVFESNSSSTHSLTMCMKSDYDKWCNGELVLAEDAWWLSTEIKEKFVTKEEAINLLQTCYKYLPENMDWDDEEMVVEVMRGAGLIDSEYENEYLEGYYEEFTTPSGETIVAFGEYGNDY